MTTEKVRVFACRDHAPLEIVAEPYDDGAPSCSVCGTANYAVKPYLLWPEVVARGWRTVRYETVRPA